MMAICCLVLMSVSTPEYYVCCVIVTKLMTTKTFSFVFPLTAQVLHPSALLPAQKHYVGTDPEASADYTAIRGLTVTDRSKNKHM